MWSTTENASVYPVLKSKDGVSLEHNFVVISYDLLRNEGIVAALMKERWDHVILDEAHALKDPKGNQRTRFICAPDGLPSVSDRMTLLSGTILPNQPIECYNAVRLMNWEAIDKMSLEGFREEYYEEGEGWVRGDVLKVDENGNEYVVSELHHSAHVRNRPVNLDDLQDRLRSHVMVRRLKEDVLTQLPKREWHPLPLIANAAVRKALKHPGWNSVARLHEMDPDHFNRGVPVDGEVATAFRRLGEAKAPMVADFIEELLKSGVEKVIVGAWHRSTTLGEGVGNTGLSVLHYLQSKLRKYGLAYMDGTTNPRRKQDAVDSFQNDSRVRVILGQLKTIGEGHTLTAAQDVVLAEPFWVPGVNEQFLDRAHRLGQEGAYVTGWVPIIPGTMDERVFGTAIWKDRNIFDALDRR